MKNVDSLRIFIQNRIKMKFIFQKKVKNNLYDNENFLVIQI